MAAITDISQLDHAGKERLGVSRLGIDVLAEDLYALYRDARALWFEEGTAEIQKTVIARELLHGHP